MDSFAGLVVLFIVIGLIDKLSKGAKKSRRTQNEPNRQPAGKAAEKAASPAKEVALPVQAARKPAFTEGFGTPEIQRAIEAAKQAKAAAATKQKVKEKTSIEQAAGERKNALTDKEGCIGGSIAHTQHEGEGKAEHAEHMKRTIQVRPAPTARPAVSVRNLRAEDMRKAVILSEILDKPKALRR